MSPSEGRSVRSEITVARDLDPGVWNEFVARHGGPIFSRWEWGTACEDYGHERVYLAARLDGELVGCLPLVHVSGLIFGSKLVSMPFAERGSIVLDHSAEQRAEAKRALLDRTRELADSRGVDFVSLRGNDLGEAHRFENKQRWVTFEIPLGDGPEAVWDAFASSRRGHVRQGRSNDLDFRVGDSIEDLRDYYDLYLASMRGHGSPPHSFGFFERLWEEFHEAGHMRLYLVESNGRTINGIVDFPFGERVYHWGEVADYDHRDLDGGSYLLWRALEWASAHGFEWYDLGRTREGSGVYMYKKTFGGEKVWLDDYHYYDGSDVDLPHPNKDAYEPIKRLWRRVPLRVTRLVGPHVRKRISL